MNIESYKSSNSYLRTQRVSFSSSSAISFKANEYKVVNTTFLKKTLPVVSFVGTLMAALGYAVGSFGLFYDLKLSRDKGERPKQFKDEDGARTVTPQSKVGKTCMKIAKVGLYGSSVSGITCGIVDGLPMMTIGNTTEAVSIPIIETPVGTALFGLAIASIFGALALDNTPELKLNPNELMAAKGIIDKTKLVAKNIGVSLAEIGKSIGGLCTEFYKSNFWKENFFHLNPKNIVIKEAINKNGIATFSAALRHNRNYAMHIASFVLGLGSISLILSKVFEKKKIQRNCLRVEEAGFLLDNFGVTRYGLDKITIGKVGAGSNFAIAGVINAISQFMGLDNQDGRAMQWLGIALVFGGYAFDRGKMMKDKFKENIQRPELTEVIRNWKFDIASIIPNETERKEFVKTLKSFQQPTHPQYIKLKNALADAIKFADEALANEEKNRKAKGEQPMKPKEVAEFLKEKASNKVNALLSSGDNKAANIPVVDVVLMPSSKKEVQERLVYCSEKIFGKIPKLVK